MSRDALLPVLGPPEERAGRSASILYKCKQCRRSLATSNNLFPHVAGENPYWYTPILKQSRSTIFIYYTYLTKNYHTFCNDP